MEDTLFWDNPLWEPEQTGFPKLPPRGIVLDAPTRAPLESRDTLPVVVRRTCSVAEERNLPYADSGVITAIDVDRNEIFANVPVIRDNALPTAKLPPGEGEGVLMYSPTVIELRQQLGLPWRSANLLVTALLRDVATNRAAIQLARPESVLEDPEVREYLAARRGELGPRGEYPPRGHPLPAYDRVPGSPAIPDAPGIALAVDRVAVIETARVQCVIRGAFRVPVKPEDVFRPDPERPPLARPPTALVGIHVLLTGSETAMPATATLRVPTYDPVERKAADPHVTGYFAFHVDDLYGLSNTPQTYFVYAFCRHLMSGPFKFSLITEDMLPPGHR